MSIFIICKYIETDKWIVDTTNYRPDKLSEEDLSRGFLVDSIPEPTEQEGKRPVLYCNPKTKELWYEYEDIPKTKEEILEEKVATIQQALDDLILGGM